MGLFRFAGDIWNRTAAGYRNADKALGGLLPGGGTAHPFSRVAQEVGRGVQRVTQSTNPSRQAAVEYVRLIKPVITSAPAKAVRDVVLTPAPPQVRSLVQAFTGGSASGGPFTELPSEVLPYVKTAVEGNWRPSNVNPANSIQYNLYNSNYERELDQASQYSGDYTMSDAYQAARNTLGSFGAIKTPEGVLIKDKWKVDEPYEEQKYSIYPDLQEGGKLATDLYRFARDTGLYKPLEYNVNIPYSEWDKIKSFKTNRGFRPSEGVYPD